MAKSRSKKRKRQPAKKKSGGVMMGMRGGIKNIAGTVAGSRKPKTKKGALMGTLVTIALLVAAAALLLQRYL